MREVLQDGQHGLFSSHEVLDWSRQVLQPAEGFVFLHSQFPVCLMLLCFLYFPSSSPPTAPHNNRHGQCRPRSRHLFTPPVSSPLSHSQPALPAKGTTGAAVGNQYFAACVSSEHYQRLGYSVTGRARYRARIPSMLFGKCALYISIIHQISLQLLYIPQYPLHTALLHYPHALL